MKKKTTSRLPLPLLAQILLPLLVAVLCAGILLLGSIRPYEMAKTYLKVAFMDGSGVVSDHGTNGLNIVQTDIDTDYTGETAEEGTPVVSDYGSQCAVLEAKSIGLYAPVRNCWKRAPARHRHLHCWAHRETLSSAPMSTPFSMI